MPPEPRSRLICGDGSGGSRSRARWRNSRAAAIRFSGDRIAVVPNGLCDEIITPRPAPIGGADFTVAMVASLTRPKLQHVAIAAFAEGG